MSKVDTQRWRKNTPPANSKRNEGTQMMSTAPNKGRDKDVRRLFYVCPPQDACDGIPMVRFLSHQGLGGRNNTICLQDEKTVELLQNPLLQEYLEKRDDADDFDLGRCPAEEQEERYSDFELASKYVALFVVIPWATLEGGKEIPLPEKERVPSWLWAGPQIHDGVLDVFEVEGDVTDPAEGCLLLLHTTGVAPEYYKLSAYKPSPSQVVKAGATSWPFALPKPQRVSIAKHCVPGGDADLMAFVARMAKSNVFIADQIGGAATSDEPGTTSSADDGNDPGCFAEKDVFDPKDKGCRDCHAFVRCAAALGVSLGGEPVEKSAEPEVAASAVPAKRGPGRPRKNPEPEPAASEEDDEYEAELKRAMEGT